MIIVMIFLINNILALIKNIRSFIVFYKIYVENNILIEKDVEYFHRLKSKDLDLLLDRLGDSQFVLLGEASPGTSEFYGWCTGITNRLVKEKDFLFDYII